MKRYLRSSVSAIAMTAMVISGVAVATVGLTAAPAFSKSSNSNSGRDRNNRGGNSNNRGATASSLGAINAANANANAFANASENSRVGSMIELYKVAVTASVEAKDALVWFEENCGIPSEDVVEECKALMLEASENPDEPLEYKDYLEILEAEAKALRALEEDALALAANNRTDDEVIEALWNLLEPEGPEAIE